MSHHIGRELVDTELIGVSTNAGYPDHRDPQVWSVNHDQDGNLQLTHKEA